VRWGDEESLGSLEAELDSGLGERLCAIAMQDKLAIWDNEGLRGRVASGPRGVDAIQIIHKQHANNARSHDA
jgi:hypothetical protein